MNRKLGTVETNYAHPLRFGLALNANSDAETIRELALLAESVGYDIISVTDVSGTDVGDSDAVSDSDAEGNTLDAWTATAWIAASTERITVAPIVSVAWRNPTVLARAAASLDLLSGGRLELGLSAADSTGSGAELTGAALAEVIDILRAVWSGGATTPLHYSGESYQISGATGGPLPAHRIPVFLSGASQQLPTLAGSHADALLMQHPRGQQQASTTSDALATANTAVDNAAHDAERDPREIRRMLVLDGPSSEQNSADLVDLVDGAWGAEQVADWVSELLPLVVQRGVSDILLHSNDDALIRAFITELAPALRAQADLAIPGLSTAAPVRPAATLAQRALGIDYDGVPDGITAVEPGDHDYASVRSTYMRGGSPGLVLRAHTINQVADAVAYARRHAGIPLSIRSGGHGISGRSTNRGGLVIDVSALNSIEILDVEKRLVRVGPGARWGEVAAVLEPYGWAISSGDYGGVGVGGLATAGGIGFLGRAHGLTIDHLRAIEVVLADGSHVRASDDENPDLFWAMRGAGSNFGIATAFEFEAAVVPGVGWAELVFDASDTAGFLERWGATLEASPHDTTSFLTLGGTRPGQPQMARFYGMVDSIDPDTIISRLQPFAEIGPLYQQSVQILSYADAILPAQGDANGGSGEPHSRSGLLEHITPGFAEAATQLLASGAAYFFQIRATGGAASTIGADATAYAHRAANFSVAAMGSNAQRLSREWAALEPYFDGLYLSFDTDTSPERVREAFPPDTLGRLRTLKAQYDPAMLFNDNFAITPEENAR